MDAPEACFDQRRLRDCPIAVVDVETTGLSPHNGDRVCEVAIIRRDPGQEPTIFTSLIDPQRPVSSGAFAVNGISSEMLSGAPQFVTVIPELDRMIDGAVFIAHNAPFDMGFLRNEYELCDGQFSISSVIDTLALSRRYLQLRSNSLASVARYLQVRQSHAHRALSDCETTLGAFDAIVNRCGLLDFTLSEITHGKPSIEDPRSQAMVSLPATLVELLERDGAVEITYLTSRGERSQRVISRVQVMNTGDQTYLLGFCSLRKAERQFRLDRILDWRSVEETAH